MAYALPLSQLNSVTYSGGLKLDCPTSTLLQLTIANGAVYYSIGHGWPSVSDWEPEVYAIPGVHSIRRAGGVDAVRIRAAVAATGSAKPVQISGVAT